MAILHYGIALPSCMHTQIVDAVFVCFALDRDMSACTIVEVHEVVSKLPTVGPLFEQPDGNIAYGRPERV